MNATLFTLIYAERSLNGRALASINGVKVFPSRDVAVLAFFEYVKGRIVDAVSDEFVEWATDRFADFEDSLSSRGDDISDVLESFDNLNKIEDICDWYCDFMDDEETECFFQIEEAQFESNQSIAINAIDELETDVHPDGHGQNGTMSVLNDNTSVTISVSLLRDKGLDKSNAVEKLQKLFSPIDKDLVHVKVEIGDENSDG